MKHPEKLAKLTREIDIAFENGTLTSPVQYNQAIKVPYLKAVIQEALRIFPPFGVPMPRYAPTAGLTIADYYIPPGSKVCQALICNGTMCTMLTKRRSV